MKASHAILSTTRRSTGPPPSTGHSEQCEHVKQEDPRTVMTLNNFYILSSLKILFHYLE